MMGPWGKTRVMEFMSKVSSQKLVFVYIPVDFSMHRGVSTKSLHPEGNLHDDSKCKGCSIDGIC